MNFLPIDSHPLFLLGCILQVQETKFSLNPQPFALIVKSCELAQQTPISQEDSGLWTPCC
jgi:hypothetical protein